MSFIAHEAHVTQAEARLTVQARTLKEMGELAVAEFAVFFGEQPFRLEEARCSAFLRADAGEVRMWEAEFTAVAI